MVETLPTDEAAEVEEQYHLSIHCFTPGKTNRQVAHTNRSLSWVRRKMNEQALLYARSNGFSIWEKSRNVDQIEVIDANYKVIFRLIVYPCQTGEAGCLGDCGG